MFFYYNNIWLDFKLNILIDLMFLLGGKLWQIFFIQDLLIHELTFVAWVQSLQKKHIFVVFINVMYLNELWFLLVMVVSSVFN